MHTFASIPPCPAVCASIPGGAGRERITAALQLVRDHLPITRRVCHAGDSVCEAGDRFESLHIVHAGVFKVITGTPDGHEQVTGLQFKGDWLGFDGIATGLHQCTAIAIDTGEIWSVRYHDLVTASAREPALMRLMHAAMSREMSRERDMLVAICTLPADARVAGFLQQWAGALADRGLRADQITLRMTRAEIGNSLGMKLETVSRALSRLARDGLIAFSGNGRREIRIPDVAALGTAGGAPATTLQ
jgi:CRP/FNR family transcriptional regulator, anaerobic regulatory protein